MQRSSLNLGQVKIISERVIPLELRKYSTIYNFCSLSVSYVKNLNSDLIYRYVLRIIHMMQVSQVQIWFLLNNFWHSYSPGT